MILNPALTINVANGVAAAFSQTCSSGSGTDLFSMIAAPLLGAFIGGIIGNSLVTLFFRAIGL